MGRSEARALTTDGTAMRHLSLIMLAYSALATARLAVAWETARASEGDNAEEAGPSADYELVWSDEFDKDGRPDPRRWTYERGFVRNRELQWYQPESAWCETGLLIIEGRRERVRNPRYDPDSKSWTRNCQAALKTSR
jgi:hypothetical protein